MLDASALAPLQHRLGSALRLQAVAETGSTNSDLLAVCRTGPLQQPQLLVAERQTAGRGRLGRSWSSQAGASLTFSIAWPWDGRPLDGLSLAVGLALADALDPQGAQLRIKWPNDLWWQTRKLGGILIESVVQQGAVSALVVGVGLNLHTPVDPALQAAGLIELDPAWTPLRALDAVVPALLTLLRDWQGLDPAAFARRDALQGLAVSSDDGRLHGVAEGVSADGLLRLRHANGQLQTLRTGEARLRPVLP